MPYCRGEDTGTGGLVWSLGSELFCTALHHQLPPEAAEVESDWGWCFLLQVQVVIHGRWGEWHGGLTEV